MHTGSLAVGIKRGCPTAVGSIAGFGCKSRDPEAFGRCAQPVHESIIQATSPAPLAITAANDTAINSGPNWVRRTAGSQLGVDHRGFAVKVSSAYSLFAKTAARQRDQRKLITRLASAPVVMRPLRQAVSEHDGLADVRRASLGPTASTEDEVGAAGPAAVAGVDGLAHVFLDWPHTARIVGKIADSGTCVEELCGAGVDILAGTDGAHLGPRSCGSGQARRPSAHRQRSNGHYRHAFVSRSVATRQAGRSSWNFRRPACSSDRGQGVRANSGASSPCTAPGTRAVSDQADIKSERDV